MGDLGDGAWTLPVSSSETSAIFRRAAVLNQPSTTREKANSRSTGMRSTAEAHLQVVVCRALCNVAIGLRREKQIMTGREGKHSNHDEEKWSGETNVGGNLREKPGETLTKKKQCTVS